MKTILCYGDSNLRGFVPGTFNSETGLSKRFSKHQRWTGILQEQLGNQYNVIEEGLNGRTTNVDEVNGRPYRNGLKHLPMMLESHFPIDLVIFLLGTNNTKIQFERSSEDIADGLNDLIKIVKSSNKGPQGRDPKILVIAPPPMLEEQAPNDFQLDIRSIQTSLGLPAAYKKLCKQEGYEFLDASLIIKASKADGVHIDEHNSKLLAEAVIQKVLQILK
jgi:lysophospholipase L1-like esterase